ncbi:MAG: c-type cytochrome [Methylobacter sp.]
MTHGSPRSGERETVDKSEGEQLFLSRGCAGCHAIRGTRADRKIRPGLTHVGCRFSLGAGVLPDNLENFAKWISQHQTIKPENLMPPFNIFLKATFSPYRLI